MAIINGTSGDDLLSTKKRGDILNGDEGDDTLVARHGFNILLGGEGDDQLTAVSSFNILSGGAGNDTLRADRGWNLLLAGDGDDGLYASSDYNILSGDAGNDVLTVLEGRGNILHGGVGDDFLQTFGSDSTIYGDSGNDTLVIDGGIGSVLHGGDGDDSLYSFSNGNVLNGDAGNDSLYVNASSWNILNGGDGDDFLVTEFDNNILNGDAGNDYLQVNSGSGNVLNGGDGDDSLVSQFDNNILNGDAGNDTLSVVGGSGNLLDGGDGNDALSGGSGDDTLDGGAGDDAIKGSAGADTLVGGTGTDTLSYDDSPTRVIVNMFNTGTVTVGGITVQPGTAFDGFGTTDLISGFENVVGSAFNDFLQGSTNVANRLEGGAGNDTLVGSGMSDGVMSPAPGAADDTLLGGAGDDVLRQTRGHDHLDGGSGFSDRLEFVGNGIAYGGVFGVNVNLGAGTSDADPGGVDSVNGAGGDIATITGIEQVFGTAGNDVLTGGSLARSPAGGFTEIFRGNAGDDTIDGQGADTAQGAFDLDRVEYVNSPGPVIVNLGTAPIMVGPEVVAGGTARDGFGTTDTLLHVNYVMGSAFADTLIGGNPEYDNTFERFEGRGGDDFMDGGSGIDEVSYQNAPGPVTVNLGSGTATGADGNDTFVNMEGARGSQSGDVLIGSNDVNVVEHFIGDGGNDFIDGGAGIDFASWQAVALAAGGVNAFIENGSGVVFQSQAGTDTLTNIEGLVGTNSNDTLAGGMGDQWFRGRGGSDLLNGGVGSDTADYSVDPGAVTVNLATGTATDGWGDIWALGGTDTLISIENVKGSQFNDTLTGDANANRLDGGAGDDAIKGSAGADTLVGGTGTDTLSYDDSPTRVIVNMFNTGTVTVGGITVQPGTAFDGFGTTDLISGFENVVGTPFNDFLQGSTNVANRLEGGAGNDTLVGSGVSDSILGAMDDTLLGGPGNDTLRQTRGHDVIDGGDGSDTLAFATGIAYGGAIGVNVNLALGTSDADPNNGDAVNPAGGDVATVSSIEFVVGTFGNDVFTGGDLLHAPGLETGQTEFFQPLGGNDTITGMAGRGWNAAVDYATNTSLQPVSVVLGNSDNIGTASDGFGGTDTLIDVDQARGGAGNDLLVGGSYGQGASGVFVEAFRGNAGNDTIDGGGSDTVIGAYGVTDRVEYNNSPFAVVVNLGTAPISGTPYGTVNAGTARDGFDSLGGDTDTLIDINVVRGSNFNDTLIGGNPKFDNNERFEGLAGNDFIDGGSGNDEADYSSSTAAVLVNLGTGTAADGFGGTDTLVSMEWARGGDFNDMLIGGSNALERFTGGAGNDSIDGGSMTGVNYASFILGGTSGANASVANGVGTASDDGQGGTDTLVNINGLWGSNFNDTLTGGVGDQWFIGSGGNDAIDGGEDIDTVSYASDPNGVTVDLDTGTATDGWGGIWGLQGTDTLISIENVEGSNFNDSLTGDDGENTLAGGGGNDVLTGGFADDIFDYNALSDAGTTGDVITDFQAGGGDVLDLHDLLVSIGAAADPFASGSGHLRFFDAGSDTLVQIDSDGGNDSYVTLATLTGVLDPSLISASDYVL